MAQLWKLLEYLEEMGNFPGKRNLPKLTPDKIEKKFKMAYFHGIIRDMTKSQTPSRGNSTKIKEKVISRL